MIKIINTNISHLESIKKIAEQSKFLQPNNHMVYYLCCTTFSNYSFVAIKNNEVIGYLYCFNDSLNNYIWVHQISVTNREQGGKTTSLFLKTLGDKLIKEKNISKIRFATRTDNKKIHKRAIEFTKESFQGIRYKIKSLGIDNDINKLNEMEVFEITLYGYENKE